MGWHQEKRKQFPYMWEKPGYGGGAFARDNLNGSVTVLEMVVEDGTMKEKETTMLDDDVILTRPPS